MDILKGFRPQLILSTVVFLIPQLIGDFLATNAINGGRTWGPSIFSIILGLFLIFGPIGVILKVEQFETWTLEESDRRFWLTAELCVLAVVVCVIFVFDIDSLKLFWSSPY